MSEFTQLKEINESLQKIRSDLGCITGLLVLVALVALSKC